MIYDLTQPVDENLPVYPGDPHVKIEQVGQLERDGFNDRLLTMGTHNGTHMDAPAHMFSGGKQLKDYPTDRFVVPATCIDARNGFDAEVLRTKLAQPGLAVLFYTGASDYFTDEKYWHKYAVLTDEICGILINQKVVLVGIDTGSFDIEKGFPVHKKLLTADVLLIENLTNLTELVGKQFELFALPLKLEVDGAPARVVARLT
jgi:kynurenine formamidase